MKVLDGSFLEWSEGPLAVTIGVFDGVHRGHQHILETLARRAGSVPVGVVTFRTHPAALTSPQGAPPLICSVAQRIELLAAGGVDVVALLDFDDALRRMPAERFVREVLVGHLGAEHVVVGTGFRFGHELSGDTGLLQRLGIEMGFTATAVPVLGGATPVSSTAIRTAIADGDVEEAAALLGRPFQLRGTVVAGDGRGRGIGFPTANLSFPAGLATPGHGVYAVFVDADGTNRGGVANVGVRPTFAGTAEVVEVHVFDFDRDLYGSELRVDFLARLRDEMRFAGVGELVAQIGRDVTAARHLLAQRT